MFKNQYTKSDTNIPVRLLGECVCVCLLHENQNNNNNKLYYREWKHNNRIVLHTTSFVATAPMPARMKTNGLREAETSLWLFLLSISESTLKWNSVICCRRQINAIYVLPSSHLFGAVLVRVSPSVQSHPVIINKININLLCVHFDLICISILPKLYSHTQCSSDWNKFIKNICHSLQHILPLDHRTHTASLG